MLSKRAGSRWYAGTDVYDDETGEDHSSAADRTRREERAAFVVVRAGAQGFCGAFNSNIIKAAQGFIDARRALGQNVDVEPIGRKARDTFRKRYPTAVYEKKEEHYDNDLGTLRDRAVIVPLPIEVTGDHPTHVARNAAVR